MSLLDAIRRDEEKLKALKEEQARLEALPIEKQLAIALHDIMCGWNHADGCGWYYYKDEGDWTEYSRKRYLDKAHKLLRHTQQTPEEILELVKLLKE